MEGTLFFLQAVCMISQWCFLYTHTNAHTEYVYARTHIKTNVYKHRKPNSLKNLFSIFFLIRFLKIVASKLLTHLLHSHPIQHMPKC